MARKRKVEPADGPSFSEFCVELSTYYVNDEIKPALHVSAIIESNRGPLGGKWYVGVHRYPHGWGHDNALDRVVVCSACRASFGVTLMLLYKDWLVVRDLESAEETLRWETLRNSR